MNNPWNGKAVLEAFWWNCANGAYMSADGSRSSWYNYLAKLAPRIAALGFDGIWTPPPCKGNGFYQNMGYNPYDYYDLGQKNQQSGVATWFGSQDEFLRMVAVAHANGLEVYPDIVLDHCAGGALDPSSPFENDPNNAYTSYHPSGFAGPGTGRWPRSWLDFHYNPAHWHGSGDWVPGAGTTFGSDFCYQGRCSDSGSADPNCAARQNARAWFTWFVLQTGVDGFRFDDVKGYPPEIVEDLLYNAMGSGIEYFCVGEYVPDNASTTVEQDTWASATLNRSGTFDYSFRNQLVNLVDDYTFDAGSLPGFQQQNRTKTVPFINNQDVCRGAYWDSSGDDATDHTGNANFQGKLGPSIDPDNTRAQLAYAVAITVDGSPQFFYDDLFQNFPPQRWNTTADAIPTRQYIENLVWCHQKLAFKSGAYFVRYQSSRELLILERGARAIVAINKDGSAWHDAWISTGFFPNTQLHDYSGSMPGDIWTNQDGWAYINVPPLSYSVWGPAGITGGFSPSPRRTVQQFEMADDLGDSDPATPGYGGNAIAGTFRTAGGIWPAAGSQVNLFVYSDAPQQVDLQVGIAGSAPALQQSGQSAPGIAFAASFAVAQEGLYLLQAQLSSAGAAPARLYIKMDYMGPATSTSF